MARTETTQLALGFAAPDFELPDTISGKISSLSDLQSNKATVLMFICNHCPFVKHINAELVAVANDYIPQGIAFAAISANDAANYPEDSPENMRLVAAQFQFPFPYLYDESQEVAKAYDAACTPDFCVFDGDRKVVYRGRLDGSSPGNDVPLTGEDLRAALDAILGEQPIPAPQRPSIGCNIKWK